MIDSIIKPIYRKIKLSINRFGNKRRNNKLYNKKFTIISNNCYAGLIYQYLGLSYQSPTVGLYFFAPEYITFLKNFDYYIHTDLKFIETKDSKYYKELCRLGQEGKIIGVLDDVEIVFLHYHTREEAYAKWTRRCKRIHSDSLIIKFSDQNLCTYHELQEFDQLSFEHKYCFVAKDYKDIKCRVWMKKYQNCDYVLDDAYFTNRYLNIVSYVNDNLRGER